MSWVSNKHALVGLLPGTYYRHRVVYSYRADPGHDKYPDRSQRFHVSTELPSESMIESDSISANSSRATYNQVVP